MAGTGYLSAFTVLELGELAAVPGAGRTLRQLGARVIKVERPDTGDRSRQHGPFPGDVPNREASGLFLHLNAGKESVTLDIACATGRWLLGEILGRCDAIVHDLPPGAAHDAGLSAEAQPERFPHLVVASVTGFGASGPRAAWKSTDLIAWHAAAVGHRYLGDPGRRPLRHPFRLSDTLAGLLAAHGVALALWERRRSGLGQVVDISAVHALAGNVMAYGLVSAFHAGAELGRRSSSMHPSARSAPPAGRFACKDGAVQISAVEPLHWKRFVDLMGNPDWARGIDPAPRTRREHAALITARTEEWTCERRAEEVFHLLAGAGVPCQVLRQAPGILGNEQLRERAAFATVDAAGGSWEVPARPWRSAGAPPEVLARAPLLSEHTNPALTEVGLSELEIEGLRTAGII